MRRQRRHPHEMWTESGIEMEIRRERRQNRAGTVKHAHGGIVSERQGQRQGEEEQRLRERAFGELRPTAGSPRGW